MALHKHIRRLDRVRVPDAVYFITTCVHRRQPILGASVAADILRQEWSEAMHRHGWLIGRYVIMPDHVHFFCAEQPGGGKVSLSRLLERWKEWTAKGLCRVLDISAPVWQAGFFDHILRSDESYAEKWNYVRENPVRAELVEQWADWPFQGWIDFDHPRGGNAIVE